MQPYKHLLEGAWTLDCKWVKQIIWKNNNMIIKKFNVH